MPVGVADGGVLEGVVEGVVAGVVAGVVGGGTGGGVVAGVVPGAGGGTTTGGGTTGGCGGTGPVDDVPWLGLGLGDFVAFFEPDGEGEADTEADGLPLVSDGAGATGSVSVAEALPEGDALALGR